MSPHCDDPTPDADEQPSADPAAQPTAQPADAFWDELYSERERVWSGEVNRATADVVMGLSAGPVGPRRALDIGCGEGGDAIWLAREGWDTVGIDISAVAVDRARRAAVSRGVAGSTDFRTGDLTAWDEAQWAALGDFDLVTASFLLSPVEFAREDVLRRAGDRVRPRGHLVVVSHASAPPWSRHAEEHDDGHAHHDHDHHDGPMATPETELAVLGAPSQPWETVIAEVRSREAVGPDGERATLDDVVVVLRRR
ncbi:MAG: methyltransferase domain-containing protein [Nesterenkonia sp.]|nr:methyltransferase domain-containing protein [Nesterenkonia sp.]